MSREWVLKTLMGLGLSEVEVEVYLLIAQAGTVKAIDLAKMLNLHKQLAFRSLKSLQTKGMVKANHKVTTQYAVVSLEKVFDHFMKEKKEQAKALQASKEELLSNWHAMIEKNSATK